MVKLDAKKIKRAIIWTGVASYAWGHDRTGVVCVFLLLSAATLTEPLEWHGSIIARTVFLCLLSFFHTCMCSLYFTS